MRNSGLILGLALLLFACEDPGTIGIETEGNNLNFRVFYKKFILPAKLIQVDSIPTSGNGTLLVGSQFDENFGVVTATSYTEVLLEGGVNVQPTSVYDSLILQFKYKYVYGEDIETPNNIKVYQLEESIERQTYYAFNSLEYSDDPIGETTFQYIIENIDDAKTVRFDTTLRIPLSDALGRDWMNRMLDENDTTFDSNSNFIEFFSGIALVAGDTYQSISGFDIFDTGTTMNLYYHITNSDGTIQTQDISFSMGGSSHFHQLDVDRSGSPVSNVTDFFTEYTATNDLLYFESGTGLVSKIDFSPYLDFTDSIEMLIVNRADFTLGKIEPFGDYTPPPSSLIYYIADSLNHRATTEDGILRTIQQDNPAIDQSGVSFPLQAEFLGEEEQTYSNTISGFLQALFDGSIQENEILVYPDFLDNSLTVNRFLLDPENIILEVYYTTSLTTEETN